MRSLLAVAVVCLVIRSGFTQTRLVGYINVPNAGQLNTFNHQDNADNQQKISVLAASYDTGRTTYDTSYFLQYPGQEINSNFTGFAAKNIYNFLYWPKEVRQVPRKYYNCIPYLLVVCIP